MWKIGFATEIDGDFTVIVEAENFEAARAKVLAENSYMVITTFLSVEKI